MPAIGRVPAQILGQQCLSHSIADKSRVITFPVIRPLAAVIAKVHGVSGSGTLEGIPPASGQGMQPYQSLFKQTPAIGRVPAHVFDQQRFSHSIPNESRIVAFPVIRPLAAIIPEIRRYPWFFEKRMPLDPPLFKQAPAIGRVPTHVFNQQRFGHSIPDKPRIVAFAVIRPIAAVIAKLQGDPGTAKQGMQPYQFLFKQAPAIGRVPAHVFDQQRFGHSIPDKSRIVAFPVIRPIASVIAEIQGVIGISEKGMPLYLTLVEQASAISRVLAHAFHRRRHSHSIPDKSRVAAFSVTDPLASVIAILHHISGTPV